MTRGRAQADDLIQLAVGIVGDCPEAAFLVATDGTILAWNSRATEVLGIPAWEASARSCAKVVCGHSADGAPICTAGCPLLTGAVAVPQALAMRVRSGGPGSSRAVHVQHLPIKDPRLGTTLAMLHLIDPDGECQIRQAHDAEDKCV
jgi:hypothetical protein